MFRLFALLWFHLACIPLVRTPLLPRPHPCPFVSLSLSPPPADNLENLILNIAQNYTPALKDVDFAAAEPELFPDVGLWHPLAPRMYEDIKEYLNW